MTRAARQRDLDKTFPDIVREVFPGVDDSEASRILWGSTSFPIFAKRPTPATQIRHQLRRYKIALRRAHGRILCTTCYRLAEPDSYLCRRCQTALDNANSTSFPGIEHEGIREPEPAASVSEEVAPPPKPTWNFGRWANRG